MAYRDPNPNHSNPNPDEGQPSASGRPIVTRSQIAGTGWLNPQQLQQSMAAIVDLSRSQWNAYGRFMQDIAKGNTLGSAMYGLLNRTFSPTQQERYGEMLKMLPPALRAMFPANSIDPKLLSQPATLDTMEKYLRALPGHGELYDKAYNHQFLGERADGSIGAMDAAQVVGLFQKTPGNGWQKPKQYPRIVFTSSHARGDSLADVTRITHGIEAMARDSWEKPLATAMIDQPVEPGKTLMLFSCDTDKNPVLNGIALTRRINELDENIREHKTTFKHISPGAARTARLMLACMCENYYGADGTPLFDINDMRPLGEIFASAPERPILSADARSIAQHFQLIAYSKGGNVVSDALRFLATDLLAADAKGRGVVQVRNARRLEPLKHGKHGARSIMHNINTISVAARERALTPEEKRHGLRRVAFSNRHDPLTKEFMHAHSWNDEFYVIDGERDPHLAHDPVLAMGSRDSRGYMLEHPEVARRMKEFFAPHYGRAALANLFVEDGQVRLETSPGTTEDMVLRHKETMLAAMEKAGLSGVMLDAEHADIGVFTLRAPQPLAHDKTSLQKLANAFAQLRADAPGLVIAQKILDHDLPRLQAKVGRAVGMHSARASGQATGREPRQGRAA